jgi:membrane associated rhomboid family serine protease
MSSYPEDPLRSGDKPVHPLERRTSPAPSGPPPPQPVYPSRRIEIPQVIPRLTYVILGINIVVYIADTLTGGMLTQLGQKDNLEIIQGEYWRFITPMFLHAALGGGLGILHILFNSRFLYYVGPQIERPFGYFRFLAIYFLSGFAASIASFTLSSHPSIGASGALFGLIGAMLPMLYRNRQVLPNSKPRINAVLQTIGINLLFGLAIPNIDNWAHIGGLLAGVTLGWLTTPRYVVRYALTGEAERVEDETSPAMTWLWFSVVGSVLVALAYALIQMRSF